MEFGPLDSAIRVAALWAVSTAVVVWFSADFATRKPSQINPLLGLLVALALNVSFVSALLSPYPVFLALYPDRHAPILPTVMLIGAGFAAMWANSILIQLLQNMGYRFVGVKEQPIRWYRGYRPRKRRRNKVSLP